MFSQVEIKTARVKSVCFHSRRPYILTGLYNGYIHLFDYSLDYLVKCFKESQGPVRSVQFHPDQPLFVSGSDDYKVRVWNYQKERLLFTLSGHIDYVRTVFFHTVNPWIVSASDDQTVRIWNWQNRQCLAVLSGHNHYVMCAQFHDTLPFVVSCSLDQSIRLWDISNLTNKGIGFIKQAIASSGLTSTANKLINQNSIMTGSSNSNLSNSNSSNTSQVLCRHIVEFAHNRGINWVAFHGSEPLVISGSDDKLIKIWKFSEHSMWELDSIRGHLHNVTCVAFLHGNLNAFASCSEDKTLRVYDLKKRSVLCTKKLNNDRFWCFATHPSEFLLAAGHDSGLILYKITKERIPSVNIHNICLYYSVKDGHAIRAFDCNGVKDQLCFSVPGSIQSGVAGVSGGLRHSPCVLLASKFYQKNTFILAFVYGDVKNSMAYFTEVCFDQGKNSFVQKGSFHKIESMASCLFVCGDKVKESTDDLLFIKQNTNDLYYFNCLSFTNVVKYGNVVGLLENLGDNNFSFKEYKFTRLFKATSEKSHFYVMSEKPSVNLFLIDYPSKKVVQVFNKKSGFLRSPIKSIHDYDGHIIIVCKRDIFLVSTFHSNTKECIVANVSCPFNIKSTIFVNDKSFFDLPVVFYSTKNQLKYVIVQGDVFHTGIYKSYSTIYLTQITKNQKNYHLFGHDKRSNVKMIPLDCNEILFKIAVLTRNENVVSEMIKTSGALIGQSLLNFLKEQNYSALTLNYINDPATQLHLAMQCNNQHVIIKSAHTLCARITDSEKAAELYSAVGDYFVFVGNYESAENFYVLANNYMKLMLLYTSGCDSERGLLSLIKNLTKNKKIESSVEMVMLLKNLNKFEMSFVEYLESVGVAPKNTNLTLPNITEKFEQNNLEEGEIFKLSNMVREMEVRNTESPKNESDHDEFFDMDEHEKNSVSDELNDLLEQYENEQTEQTTENENEQNEEIAEPDFDWGEDKNTQNNYTKSYDLKDRLKRNDVAGIEKIIKCTVLNVSDIFNITSENYFYQNDLDVIELNRKINEKFIEAHQLVNKSKFDEAKTVLNEILMFCCFNDKENMADAIAKATNCIVAINLETSRKNIMKEDMTRAVYLSLLLTKIERLDSSLLVQFAKVALTGLLKIKEYNTCYILCEQVEEWDELDDTFEENLQKMKGICRKNGMKDQTMLFQELVKLERVKFCRESYEIMDKAEEICPVCGSEYLESVNQERRDVCSVCLVGKLGK